MSVSYVYLHSISRVLKTKVDRKEIIQNLLSASSLSEALEILRREGLLKEESNDIAKVEVQIKRWTVDQINELRSYSMIDNTSSSIVRAYYYDLTKDDLKLIINSIFSGKSIDRWSLLGAEPLISNIADSVPKSLDELVTLLRGSIYADALQFALQSSSKDVRSIEDLLDYYFILEISKVIEGMKGEWKTACNNVLCSERDYYSLSLAVNQRMVPDSIVACKLTQELLKEITSSDLKELGEIMRRSPYSRRVDPSSPMSILSSMRKIARLDARRGAFQAFTGMPFTPAVVLALLELMKLNAEDIISVVNSINLNLNSEVLKKFLSLETV